MTGDDDDEENPLQRWLDAEERLSGLGDSDDHGVGDGLGDGDDEDLGSIPEAPSVDPEAVDADTARYFWSAVVLANVAVAGVAIGVMLVGFRGQWTLGGALVLLGLFAGLRTYRIYRNFRAAVAAGEVGAEDDSDIPEAESTGTEEKDGGA